jgi:hypothetical protein
MVGLSMRVKVHDVARVVSQIVFSEQQFACGVAASILLTPLSALINSINAKPSKNRDVRCAIASQSKAVRRSGISTRTRRAEGTSLSEEFG